MGVLKRVLSFLILLASPVAVCTGQQYPVFTQYYFNEMVINPAFAGQHVQLSLTALYRNQWVNLPGAPQTFSTTGQIALLKNRLGLGLMINHDEIGSYKNEHIYGSYAYKLHFGKSTVAMGVQAGFNIVAADFSKLDLVNPDDLAIAFQTFNKLKPNFGAGILFQRKHYFIGFSVPFIINSAVAEGNFEGFVNEIRQRRYYFLRSGAIFNFANTKDVKINPSILIRSQEGQPLSADFNLGFIFYDVFSVGASLRAGDAFITFIDLKLSENFHLAYSYDWTSSAINAFSRGSHEFMLNYRTRIRGIHHNVQCPDYYRYRED
jgi:type IX secretion system PorP/SprF family membrane protein